MRNGRNRSQLSTGVGIFEIEWRGSFGFLIDSSNFEYPIPKTLSAICPKIVQDSPVSAPRVPVSRVKLPQFKIQWIDHQKPRSPPEWTRQHQECQSLYAFLVLEHG